MVTRKATAAAVAAVAGILCAGYAVDAHAALDEATLEAAATPEVADVAVEMALVLEALDAAADAGDIAAALHEHITASAYPEEIAGAALELMLEGEWSHVQRAAIASLFASYAEEDIAAPSQGQAEDEEELAAEEGARTDEDLASELATVANGVSFVGPAAADDFTPPAGGAPAVEPAPADASEGSSVSPVSVTENEEEEKIEPSPGPQVHGGSDYDT